MRIHFFALSYNTISGGGSHLTLQYLLNNLTKRGHEVTLTTIFSENNKYSDKPVFKLIEENISGSFLSQQAQISELLETDQTSKVFFLYGPAIMWAGGMYKKSGGKTPTVSYINSYTTGMNQFRQETNGTISPRRLIKNKIHIAKMFVWEKIVGLGLISNLDALLFDSPIVQKIYENFGYNSKQSIVCPEFIEFKENSETNRSDSPLFEKSPNSFHLLYTGRLTKDKGIDIIVEALKNILNNQVFLHIVGDGPQKAYLESVVQKYNLQNIRFYGWVNQEKIKQFYRESDVFVHPCRWPEPFGRTIVEAMAAGLPIITTSYAGSAWVADQAGYILEKPTPKALDEIILQILNDRKTLNQKSILAKDRSAFFNAEKQLSELETFLNTLTR